MVKHVIFWKLRPDCDKELAAVEIRAALEGLAGNVPGLQSIFVRRTYQGDWDLVLDSSFDDAQAERDYQDHPMHVAAKEIVHRYALDRVCADYVLE